MTGRDAFATTAGVAAKARLIAPLLAAAAAAPPPPPRAAEFAAAAARVREGDVEALAALARLLREEGPTAEEARRRGGEGKGVGEIERETATAEEARRRGGEGAEEHIPERGGGVNHLDEIIH